MKKKNQIWIGTDQLASEPDYMAAQQEEFKHEPAEEITRLESSRRDFLKYLGFGLGAVTMAACDIPVRKAIPYVVKPDTIVPGVSSYFASTFVQGGDYCPVLVKVRDGRPIKIEGNTFSPITRGGTSARAQASVLSLYDTSRYDGPYRIDNGEVQVPDARYKLGPSWEEIDEEISQALDSRSRIRVVSHTILSPSTMRAIQDFKVAYPQTALVQYDPVSSSALLQANATSFGRRVVPSYRFDRAKMIVGIECDFLGTWISPIEFAAQYAEGRKIHDVKQPQLSRHVQIETGMSLTGSNADNRITVRPSQQGQVIVALYNAIVGGSTEARLPEAIKNKVERVAEELQQYRGETLVVTGSNNKAEQMLVNAINDALGNYGSTIDLDRPSLQRQGSDQDLKRLVDEMNAGQVDALIVLDGANPAYDNPFASAFTTGLGQVDTKISMCFIPNETTVLCDYVTPTHHYLESWSDAEPKVGSYSLVQPTLNPVFKSVGRHGTRQQEASLLTWAKSERYFPQAEQPMMEYIRSNWEQTAFTKQNKFQTFQVFWDSCLFDGIFEVPASGSPMAYGVGYGEQVSGTLGVTQPTKLIAAEAASDTTTQGVAAMAAPTTATVSRPEAAPQSTAIPASETTSTTPQMSLSASARELVQQVRQPENSELEIVFYENVMMGGGQYASNPWLQELPDPVNRCAWGNYLAIPVQWDGGNEWGAYKNLNQEEYKGKADIVDLTIADQSQRSTVVRQFGQMPNTVALALGYGRKVTGRMGRALSNEVGTNVFPWLTTDADGNIQYYATNVAVSDRVDVDEEFACVQYHHTMGVTAKRDGEVVVDESTGKPLNVDEKTIMAVGEGYQGGLVNRSIIYQGTLAELGELEEHIAEKRAEAKELNSHTLYPFEEFKEQIYGQGHWWAMHVDLNACIGCGACEVACVAENNVAVVGKEEVSRHHEMKWLRIDRYFYGDYENPHTVYQPMMCQHCDNAPCENVCPVAATNHSNEGLNQMTYNRCIGTRYCANNCPYKVRRFNWLDYTTADLFASNEVNLGDEDLPFGADNLTRMVLNPDVTIRSRGVIEKCSFCVQRIQQGKLTAKAEHRRLRDTDVRTACQTACPTGAIVFGDRNNANGEVHERIEHPLNYTVLEETNTQPSVFYAARVRNADEELEA